MGSPGLSLKMGRLYHEDFLIISYDAYGHKRIYKLYCIENFSLGSAEGYPVRYFGVSRLIEY